MVVDAVYTENELPADLIAAAEIFANNGMHGTTAATGGFIYW
jgi:hypothetical protein